MPLLSNMNKTPKGNFQFGMVLFGTISVFLLLLILFSPSKFVQALASIGLAVTGWNLIMLVSQAISISLQGGQRRLFQIAVSIAFPILLSMYFIRDVPVITLEGVARPMLTVWFFFPLVLIGWVSWAFADQLDIEHPYFGFVMATTVLFVICFLGQNGAYVEQNESTDASEMFIDVEAGRNSKLTGEHFGRFLVYVTVAYGALLAKLRQRQVSVR